MRAANETIDSGPTVGTRWKLPRLLAYGAFVAILAAIGHQPLMELGRYAIAEELHSHTVLIPLVSWYIASLKIETLPARPRGSLWTAAGTAGICLVLLIVTLETATIATDTGARMVVIAASAVLLLVAGGFLILGSTWMRHLAFPFFLLVFMIPLPDRMISALDHLLTSTSAEVAHWFFQLAGTPVFRSGQVMELPGITIEVAGSCSGIRSTLVLFITSLIASHLFLSSNGHRAVLVALVIPLGIIRNAFRVLVIGLLCVHVRPEMIDSWVHRRGGPLFFILSLIPLFAVAAWFRHLERKRVPARTDAGGADSVAEQTSPTMP